MKIQLFALALLFVACIGTASAQKVTIHKTNVPILEVLESISQQAGLRLFYTKDLIKHAKPISIHIFDQELIPALDQVFELQPFSYAIANKTIVLVPLKNKRHEQTIIAKNVPTVIHFYEIPGRVRNVAGEPLAGVSITNATTTNFGKASSDKNGHFTIRVHPEDTLMLSLLGYKNLTYTIRGRDTIDILMDQSTIEISDVTVEAAAKEKLNLNTQIDLTNKSYMNLAQVLQGSVPGLTLQFQPSNKRNVVGVNVLTRESGTADMIISTKNYTVDQFLKSSPVGQQIIDALQNGTPFPPGYNSGLYSLVYSTNSSVELIPELRGSANFGNTEGMMVIIDGFPSDEFPANYPMVNVESVEVIKDPKELIKWGPRASAGIIMIKTNGANRKNIQIDYSMNMYYTPAPKFDRKKLQQASSSEVVDYIRNTLDSGMIEGVSNDENVNFADRVVRRYKEGLITKDVYNRQMDSLSSLDNSKQLGQLQQDAVLQNHMLNFSGGLTNYRFNLAGTYSKSKTNGLGNNTDTYGLNMNNRFNLFKNALRADWQITVNAVNSQAGGNNLPVQQLPPPYQMLVDNKGNYIYDQHAIGAEYNALIEKSGYFNHGENMLQDARLRDFFTKTSNKQTRLNVDWDIMEGLRLNSSFLYRDRRTQSEETKNEASSEVRQLINNYGVPTAAGADFYVPVGHIRLNNKTEDSEWNLRTGISYSRVIKKHSINVSLGGGGAHNGSKRPAANRIYGYNSETGYGSPIFLPAENLLGGINNFRQLYRNVVPPPTYPYTLLTPTTGDTTTSRILNWNAGLNYGFLDNILTLSGSYMESLSPNFGYGPYAKTTNFAGQVAWNIKSKRFPSWAGPIQVSSGISGNKMPDLPSNIRSNRYRQSDWDNYAIWIDDVNPVQLSGQSSTNLFQGLLFNFFEGKLKLNGRYNTQKMHGISSLGILTDTTALKTSTTTQYFSSGAEGKLRNGNLLFNADYSRSPEGRKQFNGNMSYDIKNESYFHSTFVSTLLIGGTIQNISSLQGLGLMMGTNVVQGGGLSLATNNSFNQPPPNNKNIEGYIQLGFDQDKTRIDLRYYNRSISGINNNVPLPSDPSTGLRSQITYSTMVNEGVEFFIKSDLVRNQTLRYSMTLNGAYNNNYAKEVPERPFTTTDDYLRAYRSGYNINSMWGYRWAGLDNRGNPQIYDAAGNKTADPDPNTLMESLVYMGVTRAPWNGAFIQDIGYKAFFARISLLGSFGGIMRRYIPTPSSFYDNSSLIAERWRSPGDEAHTDVPALTKTNTSALRSYLTRNSSNSFMSADFIRLQEVMIGWTSPPDFFTKNYIKSLSASVHVQNLALWAKNKYGLDVNTVDGSGRIGLPIPLQCGCTVNVSF